MSVRVALLSPCFWPEVRRGTERFVRELADGLIARGHRPRLVTSHRGLPRRSVEAGLPIVRHWRPPDGRLARRRLEDHLTHVPFSYLSLRLGDDDVAHSVFPTDALAAVRWSRRTGRPAILSYMGIPDRRGLMWRRGRLRITREAMLGSSAVVMLSRTAADACRRSLGIEARVIHPGVDLEAFRPSGSRAEEPTILCTASADEPRKRLDLLVAAFRRVRRERPSARLVLMRPRDPELARRLQAAADGLELVDTADVAPLYSRAWVTALPSFGEAFGLVLVESLACGTPVVGTNADAIPEVVDREQIGRLFDGGEHELARALLEAMELARDPATPQACRTRAADYGLDACVDAYERLYRELLESAPAASLR